MQTRPLASGAEPRRLPLPADTHALMLESLHGVTRRRTVILVDAREGTAAYVGGVRRLSRPGRAVAPSVPPR